MEENKLILHKSKESTEYAQSIYLRENTNSPTTHSQQDVTLTSNEIMLIILDCCLNASSISCTFMVVDTKVLESISTNSHWFIILKSLDKVLAGFANPLVGSIADSLTGKFFVMLVSSIFITIGNLASILISSENIPGILSTTLRRFILFTLLLFKSTFGTKEALIYSQFLTKEAKHKLGYSIFLTFFWAYFIKMCVTTGFFISIYFKPFKYICSFVGVLCGCVAIVMLMHLKKKLQPEEIDKVIIPKCIKYSFKSKKVDRNLYHARLTEKMFKIFFLLVTTIGFFMSAYLIDVVIIAECSLFEEENTYPAKLGAISVTFMLLTLMSAFVYHFFLNVFRKCKVDGIDLRLHGIAYNFMGISMILICLAVSSLRYMSTTMKGEAQLRLYNGANETVTIKSKICDKCRLNQGKLREILHIPCTVECNFQIQIEFLQTRKVITAQLQGREVQSFTYIIRENALVKIEKSDPIESSNGMSTFFTFTNVDVLQGLLIFDDEYPISLVKNLTDRVIITIPATLTFKGFKYKWEDEVYNHSTFKLASGTVYALYLHVIGNITTYETNIVKLDIAHRLNPFLLFLPRLISQFAYIIARFSLARFIMLESPTQTSAFLMSVLQMSVDIGYVSWGLQYTLSFIWIVALVVFTCVHILFQFCYSRSYTNYILWSRKQDF